MTREFTPEAPVLVDLFSALKHSGTNYCVLRNYEGLPYTLLGSDLDLLLPPDSLNQVTEIILKVTREHGGLAIWREWNDSLRKLVCWGVDDADKNWGIHIDLLTSLSWKGYPFYSDQFVLSRAAYLGEVRVAHSDDSNLISFITKLLHHSTIWEKYAQNALETYRKLSSDIRLGPLAPLGNQANRLFTALEKQDFKALEAAAIKVRRMLRFYQMLKSPGGWLRSRGKMFRFYLDRMWRRPGIFVAVMGLDGSGKSTLIELVRRDLEELLHIEVEHRHSRPGLIPPLAKLFSRGKKENAILSNPHPRPPSGLLISTVRMAYYTFDYVFGYWFSVYPLMVKRANIVFFDRYFYDHFVDPARYIMNLPPWLVCVFEKVIPRPDLVIMLLPNPEICHKRKPELPLDELRRQSEGLVKLAKRLDGVSWVDTSGQIGDSRQQTLSAVLDAFRDRLGWYKN